WRRGLSFRRLCSSKPGRNSRSIRARANTWSARSARCGCNRAYPRGLGPGTERLRVSRQRLGVRVLCSPGATTTNLPFRSEPFPADSIGLPPPQPFILTCAVDAGVFTQPRAGLGRAVVSIGLIEFLFSQIVHHGFRPVIGAGRRLSRRKYPKLCL